jgi:hypothetical protein
MTMHEGHNYRLTLIIFPMRTDSHPQGWAPAAKIDDVPPGFCSDASAEARKRSGADGSVAVATEKPAGSTTEILSSTSKAVEILRDATFALTTSRIAHSMSKMALQERLQV